MEENKIVGSLFVDERGNEVEIVDAAARAGVAANAAAIAKNAQDVSSLNEEIANQNTKRINVRDFGAVGDGVVDDRQAIVDAFAAAKNNLPCEVYFPAGVYGVSNGITIPMEYGTGGLFVKGEGRDVTTIKYLQEEYNPDVTGYSTLWYALRIWPVGMPDVTPTNKENYLHDISITELTVYDPDPIAHAWNTCKGDPNGEETHGFDLQYVNRAAVTNCNIINVGDEAIDLCGCIDAIVSGNHIVGSPAAGSAGGAISIGDGSTGVVVSGNTLNGSCDDEITDTAVTLQSGTELSTAAILPDGTSYTKSHKLAAVTVFPAGTRLAKKNYGIAVESLYVPVTNVTIANNVISGIRGNGINLVATKSGSEIDGVAVSGNIITDCVNGIASSGSFNRNNISVIGNEIMRCPERGISFDQNHYNTNISANIIVDVGVGMRLAGANYTSVNNCYIKNTQSYAMFISAKVGRTFVSNCNIDGAGLNGANDGAAIQAYDFTILDVRGCVLNNIHMNKGISNATVVENTTIALNNGGDAIAGTKLERVTNCDFNAKFRISKPNAIVSGVRITSDDIGTNAITIAANRVSVTGCVININNYKSITESSGVDYNIITNNMCNKIISKVGEHTIETNNITVSV